LPAWGREKSAELPVISVVLEEVGPRRM